MERVAAGGYNAAAAHLVRSPTTSCSGETWDDLSTLLITSLTTFFVNILSFHSVITRSEQAGFAAALLSAGAFGLTSCLEVGPITTNCDATNWNRDCTRTEMQSHDQKLFRRSGVELGLPPHGNTVSWSKLYFLGWQCPLSAPIIRFRNHFHGGAIPILTAGK